MATKKQKREAALAKREKFMEEERQRGLEAQQRDREKRAQEQWDREEREAQEVREHRRQERRDRVEHDKLMEAITDFMLLHSAIKMLSEFGRVDEKREEKEGI